MCGIAGVYAKAELGNRGRLLIRRMTDAIAHRGPDDDGFLLDGPVALGMRRLSIIDLDGGRQPIGNEDGSIPVVFNGEIYNYRELRRDLLAAALGLVRDEVRHRVGSAILVGLGDDQPEVPCRPVRGRVGPAARAEQVRRARALHRLRPHRVRDEREGRERLQIMGDAGVSDLWKLSRKHFYLCGTLYVL